MTVCVFLMAAMFVGASTAPRAGAGAHEWESGKPAVPGLLPPHALVHGFSLRDVATAWNNWAFGTPASVNPILAVRCERSPLDVHIFFMPVSLGGEYTNTCYVEHDSFLVLVPGGYECSQNEGNGSTPTELRTCVEQGFDLISHIEFTLDGQTAADADLEKQIVTSRFDVLPADNLAGVSPNPTMLKAYVLVVGPLSRGTHTLRAYDEFASLSLTAGITYTIVVR